MPTDFSRRSSSLDGRRSPYTTSDTRDYARSTSPDKGNFDENEEFNDGGKRERKYIWKSPGSSPEPDDSSTSGDEGRERERIYLNFSIFFHFFVPCVFCNLFNTDNLLC